MTVARAPPPLASGRVHEPSHTGSLHRYCAPPRSDIYNPDGTSRLLAGWLRGAGDDQAAAGLGFVKGHDQHGGVANDDIEEEGSVDAVGDDVPDLAGYGVPEIEEDAFRELYYSHVGGFDQRWIEGSTEHWLDRLRNNVALGNADAETRPADLVDRNTFVSVSWGQTRKVAEVILAAVAEGGRGTRATMEVDPRQAGGLGRMGFRREHADASPRGTVFMSLGSRGCTLQLRWLARPAACISSGGTTTQRVQAI